VPHSTPSRPDPAELLGALPHVFIDRSLGALQLPAMVREAGFTLTTMREHHGEAEAKLVADVEWIALTAERGWIGFHKDAEIRRNEVERQAVVATKARMFCMPRADITAADLAARYISNLPAITAAAQSPGPYIYSVQPHQVVRLPMLPPRFISLSAETGAVLSPVLEQASPRKMSRPVSPVLRVAAPRPLRQARTTTQDFAVSSNLGCSSVAAMFEGQLSSKLSSS